MKYIVIFSLALFSIIKGSELPSNFKICSRNDPNLATCVNEAATQAIKSLADGIPSLHVGPVEPLLLDRLDIGEGGTDVVSLKQSYRNIKVHGLTRGFKATNYDVDLDNLVFKSDAYNPKVDFVADCKIDGRLLVFHIHGSGPCNITMLNLRTKNTYYGEKYEKDGETYMRLKKYIVKFTPEKVILDFERLFKHDSFLRTQINPILNSNSKLIFHELQSSYEDTFASVFIKIGNQVFSQISFNKIFPE